MFAVVEMILPSTNPPPWLHLPFLILIIASYTGIVYIAKATQDFYVYEFLDPSKNGKGRIAAHTLGVYAIFIAVFVVVWLCTWLRLKYTGTSQKSRSDRSQLRSDPEVAMSQLPG